MCNNVTVVIDEPKHICVKSDWYVQFEPEKQSNEERRKTELCLKTKLHEKIARLVMGKDEILVASYAERGNRNSENYDLENRLFYNLKANSIFKEKAPTELIFQKRDNTEDKTFIYEYTIEEKRKIDKIKELSDENRLASWENVELKISIPNNPERYFASLRSKEISFNKNEGPNSNTVIRYNAKPYTGAFGIKIKLTVPYSTHPAAVMKPLLDGVICAFHGEREGLAEQFPDKIINADESWNVLGSRAYLQNYGKDKVKWNPADEAKYLQFGWIIVNKGSEYKMSGSIYKW